VVQMRIRNGGTAANMTALTILRRSVDLADCERHDDVAPRETTAENKRQSHAQLRYAPFYYQANPNPLQNPRLSKAAIEEFIRSSIKGPGIVKCWIDWDSMRIVVRGTFVGSDGEDDFVDANFAPYEVRKQLVSNTGGVREGCEMLVNQVETVWATMEERFRRAVEQGHCRIFARCDKAHASKFTQITADAFELFEVVDWKKGIAKRGDQDWLFALYAAPPLPQSSFAPGLSASATSVPEPSLQPLEQEQIDIPSKKPARETVAVARVDHAAIEPKVFNIKEAVAYSKIGRSVLYKLIEQGKIIAQKLGRRTLISKETIDSYLQSLPTKTAAKRP
jgi:excisionase family DNA binding protein